MRRAVTILLVALCGLASTDGATARVWRRHHLARRSAPHFVFATPQAAAIASGAGFFGGYFETGLLGPATADPYEKPRYGYGAHGYYGPGYSYPGY